MIGASGLASLQACRLGDDDGHGWPARLATCTLYCAPWQVELLLRADTVVEDQLWLKQIGSFLGLDLHMADRAGSQCHHLQSNISRLNRLMSRWQRTSVRSFGWDVSNEATGLAAT